MTDTLPGLDLPPRSIADILRRVQARAAPDHFADAGKMVAPALPLPVARPRTGGVRWHRHDLGDGAYELRAHGRAIACVTPHPTGNAPHSGCTWRVAHIGASSTATGLTAAEADALAARIARMVTAG